MKPDSPEYQEAYTKEMQRLEAEAGTKGEKKPPEKAAETTSTTDDPKGKKDEAKTETDSEIKARLEKAEKDLAAAQKAIKDTQRWGHESAAKVKRLEKEAEERGRRETLADNQVLKANPGLEDAIKAVAGTKTTTEKAPQEVWLESVSRAIPDVEELLGDADFSAKAKAKRSELGSEWDDPLIAIRELSSLKSSHLTHQNVAAAVESARKDFEAKAKKKGAMEVPGGSGGKGGKTEDDDAVKRYSTMSKEDFAKERSKVMGY